MEDNITSAIFNEPFEEQHRFEHATKGQRLINYAVDTGLYYFLLYELFSNTGSLRSYAANQSVALLYAFFSLPVLYTFLEGVTKGRSPGKYITGTVVVKQDLTSITWKDAIVRSLLRELPIDPLSGFFGPPIHDKWSRTMVIKKNSVVY